MFIEFGFTGKRIQIKVIVELKASFFKFVDDTIHENCQIKPTDHLFLKYLLFPPDSVTSVIQILCFKIKKIYKWYIFPFP